MIEFLDVAAVRRDFPITGRMLYFDAAHQTPLSTRVRAELDRFYSQGYETAGPKSRWLDRVELVRAQVARLIGAAPSEIAFTKNTSEGLNIAANSLPLRPGDNVAMVEGDHPNNAYAFLHLRRKGVETRFVPLRGETADAATFEQYIDERTRAISLSHVTFHAGHRFDVGSIADLCKARGLFLVVDTMQSVGVLPLDVKALGISMAAFGCHKGLLVPQGLGVLYCDGKLDELEPAYLATASLLEPPADFIARPNRMELKTGAGRFEIGNFNLPAIHALGASLDLIEEIGVISIEKHILALSDRLIKRLDELGIALAGPRTRKHRTHIHTLLLPVEKWLPYFEEHGVRVSPERDGIRVSFAMFNTLEEIDRLIELIARRLRSDAGSTHAITRQSA